MTNVGSKNTGTDDDVQMGSGSDEPDIDGLILFLCYLKGWDIEVIKNETDVNVVSEQFISIKKALCKCDGTLSVKDDHGTIRVVIEDEQTELLV